MMNQEIPVAEWSGFLEQFTKQHEGRQVSLETTNRSRTQTDAHDLPLQGISLDRKGSDHGAILMTVGSGDTELTHAVDDPRRVRLLKTSDGADEGLEIESADGSRTRLAFRGAASP